jgi:glycosyltransferase involved in cell wall biosynthesis
MRERKIVFAGSLAQRYKGLHVLIDAMRICRQEGAAYQVSILGDGRYRDEYCRLVRQHKLEDRVRFLGTVADRREYMQHLCRSDIFVMPSLTEGLPRALIEAMACGLACIGTRVGGIPELLESESLVEPDDSLALAHKLIEFLGDTKRLQLMGARNRRVAWNFRADVLWDRCR